MTRLTHVRGDEHPLGQGLVFEVLPEHSQVLGLGDPVVALGDTVVDDGRVVLADVVVGSVLLIYPGEALETAVGHVLLVLAPADALGVKQVNDGRHIGVDEVEVVVVHAKVVTTNCSHVVRLGRVRHSEMVAESDTLGGQPGKIRYRRELILGAFRQSQLAKGEVHTVSGSELIVGILEPDDCEAVEHLALDIARGAEALCGGLGGIDVLCRGGRVLSLGECRPGSGQEGDSLRAHLALAWRRMLST